MIGAIGDFFSLIVVTVLAMLQLTLYLGYRIRPTKHILTLNFFVLSIFIYFCCISLASIAGDISIIGHVTMNAYSILIRRVLVIISTLYFIKTSWDKQ